MTLMLNQHALAATRSAPDTWSTASGPAALHAHVADTELHHCHVTAADLRGPHCWLLREPNGHLRLATLAPTPAGARARARRLLRPAADAHTATGHRVHRALPAWMDLEAQGYRIVHPTGAGFHAGRPADCWGRTCPSRFWQLQVVTA